MKDIILLVVIGLFLGLTAACTRAVHNKEEAYAQQMEVRLEENRNRIRGLLALYDQFGAVSAGLISSYAGGAGSKGNLQSVKNLLVAEKAVFAAVFEPCPASDGYGWAFDKFEKRYMESWAENRRLCDEVQHLKRSVETTLLALSNEGGSRG